MKDPSSALGDLSLEFLRFCCQSLSPTMKLPCKITFQELIFRPHVNFVVITGGCGKRGTAELLPLSSAEASSHSARDECTLTTVL